jgi:hypothetical protein
MDGRKPDDGNGTRADRGRQGGRRRTSEGGGDRRLVSNCGLSIEAMFPSGTRIDPNDLLSAIEV